MKSFYSTVLYCFCFLYFLRSFLALFFLVCKKQKKLSEEISTHESILDNSHQEGRVASPSDEDIDKVDLFFPQWSLSSEFSNNLFKVEEVVDIRDPGAKLIAEDESKGKCSQEHWS